MPAPSPFKAFLIAVLSLVAVFVVVSIGVGVFGLLIKLFGPA